MATSKQQSVKLVDKPLVDTFSKPQARPTKSKPSSHGLPWEMTAPEAWDPKIQSVDECMSHLSNTERLTIELERFGHFTVDAGYHWTQAEVDAEWDRLNASKLAKAPTEPSPAFMLNWDFKPASKPASEPQYIIVDDTDHQPSKPSKPVIAQCTPNNYWDEWRAREGIVMRHLTQAQYGAELRQKKAEEERQKEVAQRLLKKRKSDEDWGKYFYF